MAEQLLNIKFVSEVEKYPCLYDYSSKEYSKKDITEKAWAAVGKAVNLTALQAKEKWKNLRCVFVRNLKPAQSGSSKKKKYYLTDAMQFAIPYIKIGGTPSGSLPIPENQDDEENEPQELNKSPSPPITLPPPKSPTPPAISSIHGTERCSTPLSDSNRRSASVSSNQNCNYKRNYKNIEKETNELFNKYLKSKINKQSDEHESTNNNANKMFLLSLLPDLNCMTPKQTRLFKRRVIDLIDNVLNEPSSSSQSQTPTLIIPSSPSQTSTNNIELPSLVQYNNHDEVSYLQILQEMSETDYNQT